MSSYKKIGLIGLDTSHAIAFTKLFNDATSKHYIPGYKVTCGYPGGSPDMDISANRVEGFTKTLKTDFGLTIHDSPEAVAKEADLVFITAGDGRAHRALFEKIAPFEKPTFIDKPLAATVEDAQAIIDLATQKQITMVSCSSLRYADKLTKALADAAEDDPVTGVDVCGPLTTHPQLPGLLWYGVHAIEMLVSILGPQCVRVHTTRLPDQEIVVAQWSDGRLAAFRGVRESHERFGLVIHRKSGMQFLDVTECDEPWYYSMHKQLAHSLLNGETAVPHEETMAVMNIMLAANFSRDHNGQSVKIAPSCATP